jgi:DeoR family transcriptional regulator of aga operon
VLRDGAVPVETLAARLGVSRSTMRRDLAELERKGLVRRTHGGVTGVSTPLYEPFRHDSSFQEQEGRHADEKRRIGLAAAELVRDGETIGLTPGTTATEVARALRHRRGITIVTNTVNVAMELSGREGLEVYVTGGYLRGGWFSLVGASSVRGAGEIFLDRVFIGVNAVHAERGLTCLHPEEAAVNRALVAQARQRVVVADRSKLGNVVSHLICPTSEVHVLITDRDASDEDVRPFTDKGIEVRRA